MQKESSSTPWKYITASQLISEVKQSLRKYEDLIEDVTLLKYIIACNDFLGERLHKSRQCKITVNNNRAPIPHDMWKIELMFGIENTKQTFFSGIMPSTIVYHPDGMDFNPSLNEQIKYLGVLPDTTNCNNCGECDKCCPNLNSVHVSAYDTSYFQTVENKRIFPLKYNGDKKLFMDYSPCDRINSGYNVDLDDGEFRFSFPNGEIYLSYLADLTNSNGELLVPDDERLLPYYERTLEYWILRDLVLNTDLDLDKKYNLVRRDLTDAKLTAMDFISGWKANQLDRLSQKNKMNFYNKWYKNFDK